MEYIDGISLFNYCREQWLSLRARLLLFKNMCSAVQHADQNLVIHRDLKPDNILVVVDGTPRLLDLGTAKLLSPLRSISKGIPAGMGPSSRSSSRTSGASWALPRGEGKGYGRSSIRGNQIGSATRA